MLEVGAAAGPRIGRQFGVVTSGTALLRLVRQAPEHQPAEPRVVGIDDWAFKKGTRYGTMLIDLERHCPIDLLPDRQVETVAEWLRGHPTIQLVARDRSQEYARAITLGAPQAIQVADRWHLLKNLGDARQRVFEPYTAKLRRWAVAAQAPLIIRTADIPVSRPTQRQQERSAIRRVARLERYQQVRHLHEQGWHQVAIADFVGISLKTVRRYLAADGFPERRPRHYPSKLAPFKGYVLRRWNEGCHNAVRLADEIREQGYPGGLTQVRDYLARLRRAVASHPQPAITPLETLLTTSPLTPRRAAYLLLRPPDANETLDREFLAQCFALFPELRASIELFQVFATLVREKRPGAFDEWLHQVLHTDCAALKQFARGLQSDKEAVRAALSLSWSSGQCEGQINRLKFIKRQGYGRAKFDLLRLRVLHPT